MKIILNIIKMAIRKNLNMNKGIMKMCHHDRNNNCKSENPLQSKLIILEEWLIWIINLILNMIAEGLSRIITFRIIRFLFHEKAILRILTNLQDEKIWKLPLFLIWKIKKNLNSNFEEENQKWFQKMKFFRSMNENYWSYHFNKNKFQNELKKIS